MSRPATTFSPSRRTPRCGPRTAAVTSGNAAAMSPPRGVRGPAPWRDWQGAFRSPPPEGPFHLGATEAEPSHVERGAQALGHPALDDLETPLRERPLGLRNRRVLTHGKDVDVRERPGEPRPRLPPSTTPTTPGTCSTRSTARVARSARTSRQAGRYVFRFGFRVGGPRRGQSRHEGGPRLPHGGRRACLPDGPGG